MQLDPTRHRNQPDQGGSGVTNSAQLVVPTGNLAGPNWLVDVLLAGQVAWYVPSHGAKLAYIYMFTYHTLQGLGMANLAASSPTSYNSVGYEHEPGSQQVFLFITFLTRKPVSVHINRPTEICCCC